MLIIHNVSRECGGKYECEADNKIGDIAKRQMFIDVRCKSVLKDDTFGIAGSRSHCALKTCANVIDHIRLIKNVLHGGI